MAWTTPVTWTPSLVTVAQFNEQIRDNLNALKTPPGGLSYVSANYTAASGAAFTNVDFNDTDGVLRHTITIAGSTVKVNYAGTFTFGNGAARGAMNISINGSDYFPGSGFWTWDANSVTNMGGVLIPLGFSLRLTGLTPGAITARLRWAVSHNTTKLIGSAQSGPMIYEVTEAP